jgi:hypothetical protein
MLDGERFRQTKDQLPAQMGASGLLFSPSKNNVILIEAGIAY